VDEDVETLTRRGYRNKIFAAKVSVERFSYPNWTEIELVMMGKELNLTSS
jgi:hypothetical protein